MKLKVMLLLAVLSCCMSDVHPLEMENPVEYLQKGCSNEGEMCQLLKNIQQYINSNLIHNFKGLKLKRDFVGTLQNTLDDITQVLHVKYMTVEQTPNYQVSFSDELQKALNARSIQKLTNEVLSVQESFSSKSDTETVDRFVQNMSLEEISEWLEMLRFARKPFSNDIKNFLNKWSDILLLPTDITRQISTLQTLPLRSSLTVMGLTDVFMRVFWPFRHDISKMNQKLGYFGLKNHMSQETVLKSNFFKSLESVQAVQMPYADNEIIYSFDDPELVDGINRSGLVLFSKKFIEDKQHIFNDKERKEIVTKTKNALNLIEKVSPELYRSIVQLVSCFAFYKTENPKYQGGSTSSALGIIWLDPSSGPEWSVPFYAEMIVHEFIHMHLFYAEFVHGTYSDGKLLSKAKVVSAIRGTPRDYDKSFHAAYVAAGLAVFNTKAGYLNRAEELAKTLRDSVDALVEVNTDVGVLDTSGNAMLQFLVDFMTLSRIERN